MPEDSKRIKITASSDYEVVVGTNILSNCGRLISEVVSPCKAAVISDDKVYGLYGKTVSSALNESGFDVCSFVFPNGERSKTIFTLSDILEYLSAKQITRSDLIIALGGGVVGDIAGFAAGVYLRGLRYVQMPTTLLAAVDSSVGGKTAVNLAAGKNLAGVFKQPSIVVCDCASFRSLSDETFGEGISESIKYGVLKSPSLFSVFENFFGRDTITDGQLEDIVAQCVSIKGQYVKEDEFDRGERQFLNLGHTVGHAVEKCSNYSISHGHAVSIGMAVISRAAEKTGFCEAGVSRRIVSTLEKCGLPTQTHFSADELSGAALSDKKREGGQLNIILPKTIGDCRIEKIPVSKLRDMISVGLAVM